VSRGACGAWRLKVKSQLDNLGRVRDFVSGQVLPDDLPGDGAGEFLLAVDEAVSNVMMHGAPSGDADIEVQFTRDPAALSVFIRDDAPLYDPTKVEEPGAVDSPLERSEPGGFGLVLIRRLVDELTYRITEDGRNELVLVKKRAWL
jgi:anti-sigma regulatory factor (Ser/Thr protein kinase)